MERETRGNQWPHLVPLTKPKKGWKRWNEVPKSYKKRPKRQHNGLTHFGHEGKKESQNREKEVTKPGCRQIGKIEKWVEN